MKIGSLGSPTREGDCSMEPMVSKEVIRGEQQTTAQQTGLTG